MDQTATDHGSSDPPPEASTPPELPPENSPDSSPAANSGLPGCLSRAQARAVDRYAIEHLGVPGLVLMENAGINAAGAVFDVLRDAFEFEADEDSARIAILCGGGNNGGDGYVIARQLLSWGMTPRVYTTKSVADLTGDAAVNANAWRKLGQRVMEIDDPVSLNQAAAEWREGHIVVDAILGTGFRVGPAPLRGEVVSVIAAVNQLTQDQKSGFRGRVVAIDLPSGLDADTGGVADDAIRADMTVTFVAEKSGFAQPAAREYLGRVVTADIGLPASAVQAALKMLEREA